MSTHSTAVTIDDWVERDNALRHRLIALRSRVDELQKAVFSHDQDWQTNPMLARCNRLLETVRTDSSLYADRLYWRKLRRMFKRQARYPNLVHSRLQSALARLDSYLLDIEQELQHLKSAMDLFRRLSGGATPRHIVRLSLIDHSLCDAVYKRYLKEEKERALAIPWMLDDAERRLDDLSTRISRDGGNASRPERNRWKRSRSSVQRMLHEQAVRDIPDGAAVLRTHRLLDDLESVIDAHSLRATRAACRRLAGRAVDGLTRLVSDGPAERSTTNREAIAELRSDLSVVDQGAEQAGVAWSIKASSLLRFEPPRLEDVDERTVVDIGRLYRQFILDDGTLLGVPATYVLKMRDWLNQRVRFEERPNGRKYDLLMVSDKVGTIPVCILKPKR